MRALELGGVGVVILDRHSLVEWMSREAQAFFGISDDADMSHTQWKDLIQIDGASVWSSELEQQYEKDGYLKTEGYCDASGRGRIAIELVMYRDQRSHERFVLIRDITDLKQHEIALREEKHNAEQLNKALEREIQKANELAVMAERANIAKSVFLTSMSHEFRTPLNGVLGYSQILSQDSSLSDENKRAVATIEKCGRHLLSLINDVLDLSKIEAGKITATWDPINIKTILNDIVDVFKVRAQSKGLELSCLFDEKKGRFEWIEGDSKLLRQVLINLIGNAIKFTDEGSVTVVLKNLGSDSGKSTFRFSVEDTGPGIEKEYLEQVFEEFYQTEAFSGHKGGTGLGLAISRKLAACMGGELKVDSKVGEGSRFWFEISTSVLEHADQHQDTQIPMDQILLNSNAKPACYLQLFSSELDSGVLRRMFGDLGFETAFVEELSPVVFKPFLESNRLLAIAISSECLWTEQLNGIRYLADHDHGKRIFWIIYMNGNRRDQARIAEVFKEAQYHCVEIPIHPQNLLKEIYSANPDLWETSARYRSTSSESDAQGTVELAEDIPGIEVVNAMLTDARIGDMRAFNQRLSTWEQSISRPTLFANEMSKMVENFKIDELCARLEKLIRAGQE